MNYLSLTRSIIESYFGIFHDMGLKALPSILIYSFTDFFAWELLFRGLVKTIS